MNDFHREVQVLWVERLAEQISEYVGPSNKITTMDDIFKSFYHDHICGCQHFTVRVPEIARQRIFQNAFNTFGIQTTRRLYIQWIVKVEIHQADKVILSQLFLEGMRNYFNWEAKFDYSEVPENFEVDHTAPDHDAAIRKAIEEEAAARVNLFSMELLRATTDIQRPEPGQLREAIAHIYIGTETWKDFWHNS